MRSAPVTSPISASSALTAARNSASPVRQLDPGRSHLAVQRHRGYPFPPLRRRAEQSAQRQGAPVVQMRVVLPGVADAAEGLDAVVRRVNGGVQRHHGSHRGSELTVGSWRRACGIPDGSRGLFRARQHPGAPMLDRLELTDRPAELVPDLGVVRRGLDGPVGDAARLGAEQDRCETGHSAAVEAGQDPIGGHQRARPPADSPAAGRGRRRQRPSPRDRPRRAAPTPRRRPCWPLPPQGRPAVLLAQVLTRR